MNIAGNKKNENILVSVLVGGFIILSACVVVCISMIFSVRRSYRNELTEEHRRENETKSVILGHLIMEEGRTVLNASNLLAQHPVNEEKILDAENYGRSHNEYSLIGYTDTVGRVYLDGAPYGEGEDRSLFEALDGLKYGRDMIYAGAAPEMIRQINGSSLLAASPVFFGSSLQGYIFVMIKCSDLMSLDSLAGNERLLVNRRGEIISDAVEDGKAPAPLKLAELLEERSDKSADIRSHISNITSAIGTGKKGIKKMRCADGRMMEVAYTAVDDVDDIFLVTIYNGDDMEKRMRPLLFRSTVACILVSMLMLSAVVYVWVTSRRANLNAEKLAYKDPVTGGYNQHYFREFARQIMDQNKEIPFMICRYDIVNFRFINESYGREKADALLSVCVEDFKKCFEARELAVHINADQFLAILVNDSGMDKRIETYRAAVNADARGIGVRYPIRFKAGYYQVRKQEKNIDVMIDNANAARRMLKGDDKRNRLVYSESIAEDIKKVGQIESQMQKSLAKGEFKVYIQGKWDIVNDCICGGEALVRWVKEDGTIVKPDEFIPLFEKNGFIGSLDFYMLEEVCKRLMDLKNAGKKVYPISVNQSRVLLHNPEYLDNVVDILKKYKVPGELIELEITESVFEEDRENMMAVLNKLKKCGVRLDMDDFGSGYSSLNMLIDVPFDVIKIDRLFFADKTDNEKSKIILEKTVDIIKAIGMDIICEGVETAEQVEFLRSIGVRYVQGYYYAKPVPGEEFSAKYNI